MIDWFNMMTKRSLENLNLQNNEIGDMNYDLLKAFDSLKVLNLSNNKLSYIKEFFNKTSSRLESLFLENNIFSGIHEFAFGSLFSLKIVNLSNNKLSKLKIRFHEKTKLKDLNLSNNEIRNFDKCTFDSLKQLKKLNLSNNKLTDNHLKDWLSYNNNKSYDLTGIDYVELNGNRFMKIPRILFQKFKRARFFNLNIVENSMDFIKFLEQKTKKDYFTNYDVNEFIFPIYEMNDDDSKLHASFNGCYLSSIDIGGEFFKKFKKDFLENGQNKDNFNLSPGEKLLVLSNLWSIAAEYFQLNPQNIIKAENNNKILLLDEIDAHMHPSLISDFMNILKTGDIHFLGFQKFLTTHNPITISFTPKDNLFQMVYDKSIDDYRIEKVKFRRHGLKSITNDLVPNYNYKPIKIVYVEGEDDLKFYNIIYNQSFEGYFFDENSDELQLKFICTNDGETDYANNAYKSVVKKQVKKYVEYEETNKIKDNNDKTIQCEPLSNFIYGIVDRDNDSIGKVKLSIIHITYQNFKSVLRPLIRIILDA